MINLSWGAASDAGCVRSVNEDDVLADPPLFVVADGMGGHSAGDVASRMAVDGFRALSGTRSLRADDVVGCVERVNDAIASSARHDPDRAGMGTTVAGLAVVDAGGLDHWMVFNVGDSRVYRFAGGVLDQLSVDHSEVQEMVQEGSLTAEEARRHPRRNVVTRWLGSTAVPVIDAWLLPPTVGERFLLCSDGLVNELDAEEITQTLSTTAEAAGAANALVSLACAAGGRDNVTAVVVDVVGVGATDLDEDTAPRPHVTAG